mgnify:CR=1 FL=1
MQYAILIMVLLLIFAFYKIKKQISEVNYLNDILYIKKQPERYIEEIDKILAVKQTEKNKVINTIQKTTGMLYAGRFDEVIETLEKLKSTPKNWLPIYYQNLVLALYFKKDKNKANKVYKEAEPIFAEFGKNEYYKEFIDIVYSVSDFYNGKGSKKYYAKLAETGANDYRKSFGYYFSGMIDKREKNAEEAEKNFKNAMEFGKGSFIEEFSMQQ